MPQFNPTQLAAHAAKKRKRKRPPKKEYYTLVHEGREVARNYDPHSAVRSYDKYGGRAKLYMGGGAENRAMNLHSPSAVNVDALRRLPRRRRR